TFTSNGGDVSPAVNGTGRGVSAISPNVVDLASPPASFTITGEGFANLGFGLPVVNFMRDCKSIRLNSSNAPTSTAALTLPFSSRLPVAAVPTLFPYPTLFRSTFPSDGGDVSPAVNGTGRGVSAISPNVVDLASPPASFTITGTALANLGFGLPVVNFM